MIGVYIPHADKLPPLRQSLEEARKHAAELAAVSDELKDARRQGALQADQARRDAEGAYAAEREQLKERASELERAKEKAEAALRVTDEELQVRGQSASPTFNIVSFLLFTNCVRKRGCISAPFRTASQDQAFQIWYLV